MLTQTLAKHEVNKPEKLKFKEKGAKSMRYCQDLNDTGKAGTKPTECEAGLLP